MEKHSYKDIMSSLKKEIGGLVVPKMVNKMAKIYDLTTKGMVAELLCKPYDAYVEPPRASSYTTTWLPGRFITKSKDMGPIREAPIMVVSKDVKDEEQHMGAAFGDSVGRSFISMCKDVGLNINDMYFTSILKFPTSGDVSVWERNIGLYFLYHEMLLIKPSHVLVLGSAASKVLCKKKLGDCRTVWQKFKIEDLKTQLFPTKDATNVFSRDLYEKPGLEKDLYKFVREVKNIRQSSETEDCNYRKIDSEAGLKEIMKELKNEGSGLVISIDSEWGYDYLNRSWLRSVQLSWRPKQAIYINLREETTDPSTQGREILSAKVVGDELIKVFEEINPKLIGHNLRSDRRLIKDHMGLDVLDWFHHDTMLGDHVVEESRPHGLTDCLLRDTDMLNYDVVISDYIREHKVDANLHGYGTIPTRILFPYGCKDVDGVRRLYDVQLGQFDEGLWDLFYNLVMPSQLALAEAEETGYLVDVKKFMEITDSFIIALDETEQELIDQAAGLSMKDFNPRSNAQVRKILFDENYLGLTPFMTTAKSNEKLWSEVANMSEKDRKKQNIVPSTNQVTLTKLKDKNEFANLLYKHRKISTQVNKLFKPYEVSKNDPRGYIPSEDSFLSYIEEDSRIHPSVSDILSSGRRSTFEPPIQTFAGKEMKRLQELLGWGSDFSVRSIITSPPGKLFGYVDLDQAELQVMAHLAGDAELIDALTNPLRDLHAENAISMFDLPFPAGEGINPKHWCEEKGYSFERSVGKILSFGSSYGIGPKGLFVQLSSAGLTCTQHQCREWLDDLKARFPRTWDFFDEIAKEAELTGYVTTPYGRRKHVYKVQDYGMQMMQERSAANHMIQSTVADYVRSILINFCKIRDKLRLNVDLCYDHHDALSFYLSAEHLQPVIEELIPQAFDEHIPQIDLKLGYSIEEVSIAWGQKDEKKEFMLRGVSEEDIEKFGEHLSLK